MNQAMRRQAAYLRKVLPPDPGGSFDVITGEAYLEPPTDNLDLKLSQAIAKVAVADIVGNKELDLALQVLADSVPKDFTPADDLDLPGDASTVQVTDHPDD